MPAATPESAAFNLAPAPSNGVESDGDGCAPPTLLDRADSSDDDDEDDEAPLQFSIARENRNKAHPAPSSTPPPLAALATAATAQAAPSTSSTNAEPSTGIGAVQPKQKRKGKRKRELTNRERREFLSFPELLDEFKKLVKDAAAEPHCMNTPNCTCLHILREEHATTAVALRLANIERSHDKQQKDQLICDMYRNIIGLSRRPGDKTNWFCLPVDGSRAQEEGRSIKNLLQARICTNSMCNLFEIRKERYTSIRKAAVSTGVVKAHGNKGRQTRVQEHDPRMPPIRKHFEELLKLGEVSNTKFVRKTTNESVTSRPRDDPDDRIIYLPAAHGIRPMYYRYMREQGYEVSVDNVGSIEVRCSGELVSEEDRRGYVSLATYRRIWRRDYPHLQEKKKEQKRGAKGG